MMMNQALVVLSLLLLASFANCSSKDGHYHDTDGDGDDEHDLKFDQEKFLGKDKAKEFEGMDAKQSVEKLRKLVTDEVDLNKDGFVTEEEMIQHLEKIHKIQMEKDIEMNWKEMQPEGDELSWETYAQSLQPGFFDESSTPEIRGVALKAIELAKADPQVVEVTIPAEVNSEDRILLEDYFRELMKQRRRWRTADTNGDGKISKEEYASLLFPEDSEKMRELQTTEMLEGMDTNKDGFVSKEEFLADVWKPQSATEKEPEWLKDQREDFDKQKDLNRDGKLDRDEISNFLFDPATSSSGSIRTEASHLMRDADSDKDGKLSIDEIANSHELFAGSQATNFGEDIDPSGPRDEL